MLRVHGYAASLNVRKVLWLCAELGLECTLIERGTAAFPASDPDFRARNPFGHVPLLEEGDFLLAESHSILRYLVRRERRSDLLPGEARSAAEVDRWIDWQATDLNESWRYCFIARFRDLPGYDDPVLIERSQHAFDAKARIVDDQLAGTGAYIAGPDFTLADIPIGLSVRRWLAMESGVKLPRLAAYYERLCERRSFYRFGGPGSPA
jgi:glutathione S-transferase